jgi:hypothetical protein
MYGCEQGRRRRFTRTFSTLSQTPIIDIIGNIVTIKELSQCFLSFLAFHIQEYACTHTHTLARSFRAHIVHFYIQSVCTLVHHQ